MKPGKTQISRERAEGKRQMKNKKIVKSDEKATRKWQKNK